MPIADELQEMADLHAGDLADMPWPAESHRWAELVFCLLNAVMQDPLRCRELTEALGALRMLDPSALAAAADPRADAAVVLRYALRQHGFGEEQTQRAMGLLTRAGVAITNGYQGRIQRYLRQKAELIRDELMAMIGGGTSDNELRQGVSHWLQNALNLPVSVGDKDIEDFCRHHGIDLRELEAAADEADLNIAVVDDLLRIRAAGNADSKSEDAKA